jgi:hypothetical protein
MESGQGLSTTEQADPEDSLDCSMDDQELSLIENPTTELHQIVELTGSQPK